MTNNTIPNVPRDLLDSLLTVIESNGYAADEVEVVDELRALLSAPSPAGVDGLEVVGYSYGNGILINDTTQPDNPMYTKLVRLSDAQAIIDGLRGELKQNDRARMNQFETLGKLQDQRDQLAGLLRDARELITHGVFEDGYCCCGSSVDSHGLGDGHAPVDALSYHAGQVCESIDAALSELPK